MNNDHEFAGAIRARRWCFTINNYNEDDLARCHEAVHDGVCRFICFGLEIAPETGTPHIQGYLECAGQKARRTLSKAFPRAAFFQANGTAEQNIAYCSKEGKFFEDGENPLIPAEDGSLKGQGRRNDIHRVKQIIANGGGMADIIDEAGSYQSLKAGELLLKYSEPRRAVKPVVIWIHGPTGTGKSALAGELAPDAWWTAKSLKWWDGYDAHRNVVIDDFRADYCTFHEMLRILDRHPYRVETKGGSRQLLATRIVVTSPFPPESVYREREDIGQLLRRIDRTIFLNEARTPETVDPEAEGEYNRELDAVDSILNSIGHSPTVSEVEGNIVARAHPPEAAAAQPTYPRLLPTAPSASPREDNVSLAELEETLQELLGEEKRPPVVAPKITPKWTPPPSFPNNGAVNNNRAETGWTVLTGQPEHSILCFCKECVKDTPQRETPPTNTSTRATAPIRRRGR